MKSKIKILFLMFFSFKVISSMEEELESSSITPFENFEMIPIELQKIILKLAIKQNILSTFAIKYQHEGFINSFDNIDISYQFLKRLSRVCKKFQLLENELLEEYEKKLREQFEKYSQEPNILMFRILVLDIKNRKAHRYNGEHCKDIFHWACQIKSKQLFKVILMILRLADLTGNHSEQKILQQIWLELSNNGNTPLHLACEHGNFEIVSYLTNQIIMDYFNININARNYAGKTALMEACTCTSNHRNIEIIKLLLNANADTSIKLIRKIPIILRLDHDNAEVFETAFDLAVRNRYREAVELLKPQDED